jgi:hypothetical protein
MHKHKEYEPSKREVMCKERMLSRRLQLFGVTEECTEMYALHRAAKHTTACVRKRRIDNETANKLHYYC